MNERKFWVDKIEELWSRRSVVWLSGVRRAGKTFLCRNLPDIRYFDCELASTRRVLEDPESFLDGIGKGRIVLDEIHRLQNPSELLKIAADHYTGVRILATGSSTLGASAKFRDTLVGRKLELWLTPMILQDLADFERTDLKHRFLRGGLPPFFLSASFPEREFQEWMDGLWARDIQELFRLERKDAFQKFVELLMAQSGGIFEASRFASPCGVSRMTILNYLRVLEATYVVHVIRPFSTRRATEIIAAPKTYGFDTGFVCYHRGWESLRQEDMGLLWEHFVLNELQAQLQTRNILYWRDKQGHEIDFILPRRGKSPTAVECKWSVTGFDPRNFLTFHRAYPSSECFAVCHDVQRSFVRKFSGLPVKFLSLPSLVHEFIKPGH